MSEQTENLQALCADCKSDLTKEPHKDDCPISLKQKADFAEKVRLENEKKERDEKEAEQKAELEKQKAIDDAKKQIEEKNKQEIERQKIELKKKHAVLAKIKKLIPNDNFKDQDVLNLSLNQIFDLYNQILKTLQDEKTKGKMEYDVTCPICNEFLGESSTYEGAKVLQKEHKKEKHPSSGVGNWLIVGLVFSLIMAGTYGAYRVYKKSKADKEKKT